MILHQLDQRVNRLAAKVVVHALARQGVRLVDEQDAAQRAVHNLRHLARRLADVARHQAAAVGLNQLSAAQKAQLLVDFGDQARHRRLARAGVAGEDHVEAHVHDLEVVRLAHLAHLDEVDERAYLALDAVQADQAVQLRHQLLERLLLLFLLLRRGAALLLRLCRAILRLRAARHVHAARSLLRRARVAARRAREQEGAQAAQIGCDKVHRRAADGAVHVRRGVEQLAHAVHKLLCTVGAILVVHRHAAAQQQRRALRKGAVLVADVQRRLAARPADAQHIARGNARDERAHRLGDGTCLLRHLQQQRLRVHVKKQLDIARAHALPVAAFHQQGAGLLHLRIGCASSLHLFAHLFSPFSSLMLCSACAALFSACP